MTDNKPYVMKKGIKRQQITIDLGQFGQVSLSDYAPMTVQGQQVLDTGKKANGVRLYYSLGRHPETVAQINEANQRFQQEFEARYPGIYELVTAINEEEKYEYKFNRMMEDESNDGVNPPSSQKLSVKDAYQQYPIAAAYLTILNYADADPSSQIGFIRRQAGESAIAQIEDGGDVIVIKDAMITSVNEEQLSIY